jgi:hypothetical protein
MELVASVEAIFETKSPVRSRYFVGVATQPLNIVMSRATTNASMMIRKVILGISRIADSSRIDADIGCG